LPKSHRYVFAGGFIEVVNELHKGTQPVMGELIVTVGVGLTVTVNNKGTLVHPVVTAESFIE
jgi:hypothetical protein